MVWKVNRSTSTFAHSIFRAIEEGKNIIRSANNGISAYIDSKGQIIKKIESTQKGVIEIDTYKKGSKTIFSTFGNKIFFYLIIFYITIIFLLKKGRDNEKNYLFTSESVSEGHPDKVCDRISDMVVDTYLGAEPQSRVACETLTTTNKVVLAGESERSRN